MAIIEPPFTQKASKRAALPPRPFRHPRDRPNISFTRLPYRRRAAVEAPSLLALVTILTKSLFALVSRHLVSFLLFPVRHGEIRLWVNCMLIVILILPE